MVVRDSADAGSGGGGGGGGDDNENNPGDTISARHFRRKSISKNKIPSISAAQQFASSNTTVSAFMGGRPKSWMTSAVEGDAPLSLPVNNQLSSRRQSLQVNNTNTSRNPFSLSRPNPAARTSHAASSRIPQLDLLRMGRSSVLSAPVVPTGPAAPAPSNQDPSTSGGPLSAGRSPATQPTTRIDIEPPSNSTSPALANTISIPKVTRNNGTQGNVLPSPTPSDDAGPEDQQDGNMIDLQNEAEHNGESNVATTPRPAPLSRQTTFGDQSTTEEHYPDVRHEMNELVQKYGRKNVYNFLRSVGVPDNSVPSSSQSNQVNGAPANASTNISSSTIPQKRPLNGVSGPQLENNSQTRLTELQRRQSLDVNTMDKRRRLGAEISLASGPAIPSSNSTVTVGQHFLQSTPSITTPQEAPSINGSMDAVGLSAQRPLVQPTPVVPSNGTPPARILPPGYGLGEKKNQHLCGTTPDRPITLQNRPALSQFLPVVDKEVRPGGLEPTVELPRMQLLREACQEEDWFYVALHQMYCLHDVQIRSLIDVTGLTQKHLDGFSVIKELIKDNKIIPQERTKWFATFPSPLPNLYAQSDFYQNAVVLVKEFLWVLPGAYQRFQNECKVRGTPPLVHELVIVMKLQSLIFQRVIFIAVRRGMWGPGEDQFTREMHDIFRENQRQYLAILDRQDTAQPASVQNIVEMHKQIALKYNDLHKAQLKHYNPRPQPAPNSLGILTRQANGQIASTTRPMSQVMNRTAPVQSQSNLSFAQLAARNSQPQLLVNTQTAQQSQGGHRASAPINYSPPILSPSATSPPNSAGMSSQMQTLQLQRLENQLQQMPGQRSMTRSVSQVENLRIPTGQISGPVLGSNNIQFPSAINSASGNGRSWSASHNTLVASVPAGAPDPMYSPMSGTMAGLFSQSPRPVNTSHTRPQASRSGRTRVNAAALQNAFLPPQNFIPNANPGLPNPTATALHLAHLRSPRLVPVGLPSGNQRGTKLYQYIKGFPLPPTVFPADKSLLSYEFSIDGGDFNRIAFSENADNEKQARDAPLKRDLRPFRSVCPGSMMYRVRCVKLPATQSLKEDAWVTTESKWPDHIFVDVNQDQVETRRKFHFGKDLPIDITDHVKNGQNTLKVSILRTPRENECSYAISVEAIEVTSHSTVVEYANNNFIPASQSLDAIKTSLNAISDDDEIAVVNNDVTINVADPFSARIFETPARSLSCLHRECFDLETFLSTRSSKPKRSSEPCMVDEWKCPLCAGDARPHRLLIDGFLLEARKEIGARGLDETKAIIVDKDGKWEPKAEPHDDDLKDDRATPSSISAPTKSKTPATEKNIVVIEIDDD